MSIVRYRARTRARKLLGMEHDHQMEWELGAGEGAKHLHVVKNTVNYSESSVHSPSTHKAVGRLQSEPLFVVRERHLVRHASQSLLLCGEGGDVSPDLTFETLLEVWLDRRE